MLPTNNFVCILSSTPNRPNLSASPSAHLSYIGALLPGKCTFDKDLIALHYLIFLPSSALVMDANFTKAHPL